MQSLKKQTAIATILIALSAGSSAVNASPQIIVPHAVIDAGAELEIQKVHHVHRRHVRRHAVVVPAAPNRSVAINGVNGSVNTTRSVSNNDDGTWSAQKSWSADNYVTGRSCQGSRNYDSAIGQASIQGSCSD